MMAAAKKTSRSKLLGYARVSTTDQDLSVQREALRGADVKTIFEEKARRAPSAPAAPSSKRCLASSARATPSS
jgi:hypothetical protein